MGTKARPSLLWIAYSALLAVAAVAGIFVAVQAIFPDCEQLEQVAIDEHRIHCGALDGTILPRLDEINTVHTSAAASCAEWVEALSNRIISCLTTESKDKFQVSRAFTYLVRGHWDEAEFIFLTLVGSSSEAAAVANGLGIARFYKGDFSEARASFEEAASLGKQKLDFFLNAAIAQLYLGDTDAAEASLAQAQTIEPRSLRVAFYQAKLLWVIGDYAGATKLYQNAYEGEPNDPEIRQEVCEFFMNIQPNSAARDWLTGKGILQEPTEGSCVRLSEDLQAKPRAEDGASSENME